MQVVNSYNSNQNFTAKIIDSFALRKFKASLSNAEADTFEKYVKDIEKINDGKKFIYESLIIGNNKVSKIHEINQNGQIARTPIILDFKSNPMKIFEILANLYKSASI